MTRESLLALLTLLGLALRLESLAAGGHAMSFIIKTTAFLQGETIPTKYTCDGTDVSPGLTWTGAPEGTKSLSLIAEDPDAPVGTWTHWIIWNIPPEAAALSEGVPKDDTLKNGSRQGYNDFKRIGYGGPCPPPGKPHRYFFRLYAMDSKLDVKSSVGRSELERAMKGHVLAQADLMARYGR